MQKLKKDKMLKDFTYAPVFPSKLLIWGIPLSIYENVNVSLPLDCIRWIALGEEQGDKSIFGSIKLNKKLFFDSMFY